jgi:hypothetical protein
MLNAKMVNARISCDLHADLCEFFAVFASIPRFKNPFKYTSRFNLNHKTVHFQRRAARGNFFLLRTINDVRGRLTLPQGVSAIMSPIRKRAAFVENAGKAEKMGLTWA